jgi:hypothetical protein
MTAPDSIGIARKQLRDAITDFQPSSCDTLKTSPWIAMSLLQAEMQRPRADADAGCELSAGIRSIFI